MNSELINNLLDYYINFIPLNYDEQKINFFEHLKKGEKYNPQFRYKKVSKKKLQSLHDELTANHSSDKIKNKFSELYEKVIELHLAWLEDDFRKVNDLSKEIFGSSDKVSLNKAKELYKKLSSKLPKNDASKISSEQMANLLIAELTRQELNGWKVEFKDSEGTEASIYSAKKIIVLKPNHLYSQVDVKRIIFHEIKGHGYQSFNAKNNAEYSDLFTSYIGTEIQYEGFAIFTEIQELNRLEINELICRYLLFMIAIKVAESNDFYSVYEYIFDLCKDEEFSFMSAYRAKFGFTDTAKQGSFQTDNSYLLGAYQITAEAEKDTKNIFKLSAGKFPFTVLNEINLSENSWISIERINKANIEYFRSTVEQFLV